jgi:hypothetical protein
MDYEGRYVYEMIWNSWFLRLCHISLGGERLCEGVRGRLSQLGALISLCTFVADGFCDSYSDTAQWLARMTARIQAHRCLHASSFFMGSDTVT